MKMNLRVVYDNGDSVNVEATARDLVAFEDEFTLSVAKIENDFHIKYLLWIAWHWLKRMNSTDKSFDDWCDDVAEIGAGDDDPK